MGQRCRCVHRCRASSRGTKDRGRTQPVQFLECYNIGSIYRTASPCITLLPDMSGTLYLVATPIGNLEDITFRAVRVLREVQLIAAEDTRRTGKLLAHYGISTPTVSLHDHNERQRTPSVVKRLLAGDSVAVVSDAGTPLVSDPGLHLLRQSLDANIPVVPIPGPSAVLTTRRHAFARRSC